jgi:hypothetical protein
MAAANRLTYPASPAWRGLEKVLLSTALSLFYASFGVLGIVFIVEGVVSGGGAGVFFGVLWSVVYGFITWNSLHLASRLEFLGGRLSWRCSLPWSPMMRPGRVRAIRRPASPRSRYVRIELDDGRKLSVLPRPGLMEFINAVHDAEPGIVVDVAPGGRRGKWMSTDPGGYIQQRGRAVGAKRGFRIPFSIVISLVLFGFVAEIGLTLAGPQESLRTLRGDLAKMHLPPGYRLVKQRQAGTDCTQACSLTQFWTWAPSSARTSSAACTDVYHAMTAAFTVADSNSPIPADAACDYYAILGDLLHPGQGKRTIEAIVRTGQRQMNDGLLIELTASYG